MACCAQWIRKRREPRKQVCLVLIGLDNAGKTTALKGVQGESLDLVAPTLGFASSDFKFDRFDVTVFDLGGGRGIRGIWPTYYAEAHGVVFVIDASDEARLQECRECLESALKREEIRGKRILVLANKQDQEGALDEIDICDQLDLEEMVNSSKSPCRVETCSAVQGIGKRLDPSIREGMQWLLEGIAADWEAVSRRVAEDTARQQEEEARVRKEKRERVMRIREEREKKEAEERKAAGLEEEPPSDDEEDVIAGGNPFAKVDDKYFSEKKQKEAEAKAKKEKKKKKEKAREEESKESSENMMTMSEVTENSGQTSKSREKVPNGKGDVALANGNASTSSETLSNGGRSLKDDPRPPTIGSQENLIDGGPSQTSITGGEETKQKKKKKKKVKKNKTAPMPVPMGGIDEVAPPPLSTPLGTPSWAQAPGHRSLFRSSQKPSLAPLVEQNSPRQNLDPLVPSSTANHKRKELPELRPRSMKPNIEDDEDVMT